MRPRFPGWVDFGNKDWWARMVGFVEAHLDELLRPFI